MTVAEMRDLCQFLCDNGMGEEFVGADHDVIYIPGPDEEEEDLKAKMDESGALYDESLGSWYVFV